MKNLHFLLLALPVSSFTLNNALKAQKSNHSLKYKSFDPEKTYRYPVADEEVDEDTYLCPSTPQRTSLKPKYRSRIDNRHSASDWVHNLKTWRHSSVLKEIRGPVLALGTWATFVNVVQKTLLWSGKTKWAMNMCTSHAAHSFLVSSLGLLLVFRTNSAYQRFLEGRKIWEQILTVSRNLSRLVTLYRNEVGYDRRLRIQQLLAAFPYLLRHHVDRGCLCRKDPTEINDDKMLCLVQPNRPDNSCFVDRNDLPWSLIESAQQHKKENLLGKIARVANRPIWICDRLGQEIMGIPITNHFTSRERLKLLGDIDKLANAVGSCERIHQTAVPLHYARHALRSLTVWILTLPFALVKDFGLMTGPVTAMVAWLLFGVYQIGHSIEDPFQGSLQLSTLCDDIRQDVLGCDDDRQSAFFPFKEAEDAVTSEMEIFPKSVELNVLAEKVIPEAPKLVVVDGKFQVTGMQKQHEHAYSP